MPSCLADDSQNTRLSLSVVYKYDCLGKMGNKKIIVPFEEVLLQANSSGSHCFIVSVPGVQMRDVTLSHLLILSHAKKRMSAKLQSAKVGGIVF